MKPVESLSPAMRRALPMLVWAAALTLVACDNSVNFSPTEPRYTDFPPVGERTLQVSGSLTAEAGSCLEATVLYDGVELPGARAICSDPRGCAELELAAVTRTGSGRHTISFQVLDQSAEVVEYSVRGEVLVTREGLALGGVKISLGPTSATLRPGEIVTFDVLFTD